VHTLLITPVGTSLLDNYADAVDDSRFQRLYTLLREQDAEWDDLESRIERVRGSRQLQDWIRRTDDASAEIESVRKIASEEGGSCAVRLLATDTPASRFAAGLMRDYAEIGDVRFVFNDETDQISSMQVYDRTAFRDGIRNLVRRLRSLFDEAGALMGRADADACAINITGGYKATLPFLTVLGELYDVPLYYKFEEVDGLLSIPQVPLTLDEDLFREHEAAFGHLAEWVDDWPAFRDRHHEFVRRAGDLIEVADNVAKLSPLGELFWGYYTDQFVFFYAPDDVYEKIRDEQPNVRGILRTKMKQLRDEDQVEPKGDHLAFDDGNNSNRIFLFYEENELYIYKTFDEEGDYDNYDKYWRNGSFDEEDKTAVMRRSERRRLKRDA